MANAMTQEIPLVIYAAPVEVGADLTTPPGFTRLPDYPITCGTTTVDLRMFAVPQAIGAVPPDGFLEVATIAGQLRFDLDLLVGQG